EEDEAGRGDTDPEHLRQQRVRPVAADVDRSRGRERDGAGGDRVLEPLQRVDADAPVHAGLPNSPSGRAARTATSSAKVRIEEYSMQQLSLVTGRYAAETSETNAYRIAPIAAPLSDPIPPLITPTSD